MFAKWLKQDFCFSNFSYSQKCSSSQHPWAKHNYSWERSRGCFEDSWKQASILLILLTDWFFKRMKTIYVYIWSLRVIFFDTCLCKIINCGSSDFWSWPTFQNQMRIFFVKFNDHLSRKNTLLEKCLGQAYNEEIEIQKFSVTSDHHEFDFQQGYFCNFKVYFIFFAYKSLTFKNQNNHFLWKVLKIYFFCFAGKTHFRLWTAKTDN